VLANNGIDMDLEQLVNIVIIDGSALSNNDINRIKGLTREHYPVVVVVVESNGSSKRFKLTKSDAFELILSVEERYRMWR